MSNTKTATKAQLEAIMGDLNPADRKILEAHMKGSKSRRVSETELRAKYPHVVEGSLDFDSVTNKQFVQIECTHPGCGAQRRTFTSDLFQVTMCDDHRKEQAKARKAAKDARIKEILAKAAGTEVK
jgi:hypothetical protein